MSNKNRLQKLEEKTNGGFRVLFEKDAEQELIKNPKRKGEIIVILDNDVADL